MMDDRKTAFAYFKGREKQYCTYLFGLVFVGVGLYFFLRGFSRVEQQHWGDFRHFWWAAEAMRNGLNPYLSGEPGMRHGYIYPPLVAWLYVPLSKLSMASAADVCVVVNALVLFGAFYLLALVVLKALHAKVELFSLGLLIFITGLVTFDKVKGELQMFQTNGYILLAFAVGLYAIRRFPFVTGMTMGFAFNIKYLVAAVVPYLFVRAYWRAALWTVAGIVLFAFLPALSVGFQREAGYLQQAFGGTLNLFGLHTSEAPVAVEPLTAGLSISVTSAIARMVRDHAPGLNPMLPAAATGVLWLGVVVLLYRREKISIFAVRPTYLVTVLELITLLQATLVFSPQTNTRHTVLTAAMVALAAGLFCFGKIGKYRWVLLAATVLLVCGLDLPPGEREEAVKMLKWHYFGGPMWCTLVAATLLLWGGLKHAAYERMFEPAAEQAMVPFFPPVEAVPAREPLPTGAGAT